LKKILVIAGPNGTGKTTFAGEFLQHEAASEFRRFERGLGNLTTYIGIVDEWAIYDASQSPPFLLETGGSNKPQCLMEDPTSYRTPSPQRVILHPSEDPDFIGAEAALKRASEKAIAKDIAAGLEPIVSNRSWIKVPGEQ
jgi:hypothetical protein